jgi:hypothetical protein
MSEIENAESLDAEIAELSKQEESAPPEETSTEPVGAEEQETPAEQEPEEKKVDSFQKRINKRTRDYYTEKARAEALEAKVAKLENKLKPVEPEPQLSDDDIDYDEPTYQRKLAAYYAKKAVSEIKQETQVSKEQESKQRVASEYAQEIKKANIPDYHEKIESLVDSFAPEQPMPLEMIDVIQLEKNPKVAVYLADNLDKAHEIANMTPLQMATEIGKLSAKVSMVKPIKTTKAPDPVKTAGGGGAASGKKIEEMSMAEIMADPNI